MTTTAVHSFYIGPIVFFLLPGERYRLLRASGCFTLILSNLWTALYICTCIFQAFPRFSLYFDNFLVNLQIRSIVVKINLKIIILYLKPLSQFE
jgi:hypothetical protein